MVKSRADGAPQLNLRVPLQHHDRVRAVVRLLREAEGFAARLDAAIADASAPLTPGFHEDILARVQALEQAVFRSAARIASPDSDAPGVPSAMSTTPFAARRPATPGKRRSPTTVTDDLRRSAHDLRAAGFTRDAIAVELGLGGATVSKILTEPRPA
jgi:hypothetical protein